MKKAWELHSQATLTMAGVEDYELPKQFIFMEQLPHNESGKVDKQVLKNFL